MFRRGNLTSKYKQYAKSLKSIKNKLLEQEKYKLSPELVNKYEKIVDGIRAKKNKLLEQEKYELSPELVNKYEKIVDGIRAKKDVYNIHKKTITVLQNKLSDAFNKIEFRKEAAEVQQRLQNACQLDVLKRYSKIPATRTLAALGLFSTGATSDAVTISGYSKHDYDILRQLGIFTNSPTEPNALVASENALETASTAESPANTSPLDLTEINSAHLKEDAALIDSPPSLYDFTHESPYQSIFNNMPPEHARNDIYTTIYNAFNSNETKFEIIDEHVANGDLTEVVNETVITINDMSESESLIESDPFVDNITNTTNNATETLINQSEQLLTVVDLTTNNTKAIFGTVINDNVSTVAEPIVVEAIPEPPAIPDAAAELASQLNVLGEATFASLGLGGYTPVGIVQHAFEFLHVSLGIPWWEAIAIGTLIIRFCMFPLVIMSQRNASKMNNHLPQMQVIQLKMTEARQSGNQLEAARYSQELMQFMKEKNLNPLKNMIVPFAQMPVFVSFFMGLRQMANVPVDSLRTGGMFWFTDLTVPDQFFALPIITSLTLWATIELGTDSAKLSSQNLQTMKYVLRAMPFVILPFTVNFPGAILCYWVSSNFISLAQVGFLRIPTVRDYFKIDPLLKHAPEKLPIKNKGFVGGLKDSWTNIKITKELEERRRIDEIQFQRAGKGPLVKTYKYDPTKQVPKNAVEAKSR